MARTYTKDDVETHVGGYYGPSSPAVNVKVYRSMRDAYPQFVKDESPDPRFTLDWIEENVSEQSLDDIFWMACESEYEYLESWATSDEDSLFPDDRVTLSREGRSGGWIVVSGLPEIEDWDAIRLGRWRKFERVAKEIAADVPYQMLSMLYLNDFEVWSDEQDDAATYNAEVPIELSRH